jgi:hypothetical protein
MRRLGESFLCSVIVQVFLHFRSDWPTTRRSFLSLFDIQIYAEERDRQDNIGDAYHTAIHPVDVIA